MAYQQKLNSYLSKSVAIWDVASGKSPCPITTDADAMDVLTAKFGSTWSFVPQDIHRSMAVLRDEDVASYDRIVAAMDAVSETRVGSWSQRNAALYSAICDTLDLSKNGKDLDLLEVVSADNGLAMYELVKFRLSDIKSSDTMARAMKLQMGLQHIRYKPIKMGVSKYFAAIEQHRTKLASLPTPKIIPDWQVVAKALRELPPLHSKFQSAEFLLEMQRKVSKTDTTLQECKQAFVSADIDNDIGGDLQPDNKGTKTKRRANLSRTGDEQRKRFRNDNSRTNTNGHYKFGDCVHHPTCSNHTTVQCTNPFGIRSVFARATSYLEKCNAVKASVAAGWSPKATNVTVPQGYGCDPTANANNPNGVATTPQRPSSASTHQPAVRANKAAMHPATTDTINQEDLKAYHKVRSLMGIHTAPTSQPAPYPHHASANVYMPPAHPAPTSPPPVRTFNTTTAYGHHYQPPAYVQPSAYIAPAHHPYGIAHQYPATNLPLPVAHHPSYPAPIRANISNLRQPGMPQPTEDDIIAAGMKYLATQAGRQDFQ